VGGRPLVVAAEDAAALLEPADAALDDVPLAVGVLIERPVAIGVGDAARDHSLDTTPAEQVPDRLDVVALVPRELVGPVACTLSRPGKPGCLEYVEEEAALMGLTRADDDTQRSAAAIADQVDLRRETATGAP